MLISAVSRSIRCRLVTLEMGSVSPLTTGFFSPSWFLKHDLSTPPPFCRHNLSRHGTIVDPTLSSFRVCSRSFVVCPLQSSTIRNRAVFQGRRRLKRKGVRANRYILWPCGSALLLPSTGLTLGHTRFASSGMQKYIAIGRYSASRPS